MNQQVPVEQICEVGLCTLDAESDRTLNGSTIQSMVEETYRNIHARAKYDRKILMGVTQTISTEYIENTRETLYILTLIGTVADAAAVEAIQTMQRFDPRSALTNLKH